MLAFRRMQTNDVDTVTDLAVRALAPGAAVGLVVDRPKVRAMVWGFCLAKDHFHLIAFDGMRAVGATAMYVVNSPFFVGVEAHVVMCFADRGGAHLIREMLAFFRASPATRMIWSMNEDAVAPAFERMLKRRYGFDATHHNIVMNKGA